MAQMINCNVCGGKGFIIESLVHSPCCSTCNGLGVVPKTETRKSILVPPKLHRRLKNICSDLGELKIVEFMHRVADDYENKIHNDEIELSIPVDLYSDLNNIASDLNVDMITFLERVKVAFNE